MLKVIILLLIISSTFVDARARRKRRQLSSSSYYIAGINPYSSSFDSTAPLTYPSGSYYSAPDYGYPNTGYSGDVTYNTNNYGTGLNQYDSTYNYNGLYQNGASQNYQFPTFGSAYGSGYYAPGTNIYGYAATGFANQYPNWNQGNSAQYFTGGTGSGLTNTGYVWYRSLRNSPFQGQLNNNPGGNPVGLNPPIPMGNPMPGVPPGK